MKHIYGPVPSRRLGFSLGVDLTPRKICSFDCIYCQLGETTKKTLERHEYMPVKDVIAEVKDFIDSGQRCDYITMSGSGEPTLNSGIGEVIDAVKSMSDIPVAVLTNSSLLSDYRVREDISSADVILPSLDAVTQKNFEKVNRPCHEMKISDIMEGLIKLKREFEGSVWLEVMVVEGLNTDDSEIESLKKVIDMINPDKVHLNTVVRPPAEEHAKPVNWEKLKEIGKFLDAEVIADFKRGAADDRKGEKEDLMLDLLRRRPCTLKDISSALGLHENEAVKILDQLSIDGVVGKERTCKGVYYFERVK
ncbi:MAG: radical SAM protein [Candidatus Altiarchaeales archaeon]|nr:radical SAM protein [Candidatus Altiarchaeales archaeon]MBD3417317.1 radical SAM protein [Candidatus Altiarchaeales archaeon]